MKKLLLAFVCLFAAATLVACGNETNTEKEYKLGMGVVVSTASSKNAEEEKNGTAQIDATVATVVLENGKIVACRLDAVQNKITVSPAGEVTVPESFKTKMEKGAEYGMAGNQWSSDNNGDGVILEWDAQAKAFEAYVVGKTAQEVKDMPTKTLENNYVISSEDALLKAGCTIQITEFKNAVVKACEDAQGVTFKTSKSFTLGVAATSFDDGSKSADATADEGKQDGSIKVYADFAASVVVDGKIAASLNDAIQPKFTVSTTGALTPAYEATKRELKEGYGMAGNEYSSDNNGDGVILEWYNQSAAFSAFVVGMTGTEVANMETKKLENGYQIAVSEDLLKAGCTIQITAIKAVVAKSVSSAR